MFRVIDVKKDGMIEIPWEILKKAGFKNEDEIDVEINGDYIIIKKGKREIGVKNGSKSAKQKEPKTI